MKSWLDTLVLIEEKYPILFRVLTNCDFEAETDSEIIVKYKKMAVSKSEAQKIVDQEISKIFPKKVRLV